MVFSPILRCQRSSDSKQRDLTRNRETIIRKKERDKRIRREEKDLKICVCVLIFFRLIVVSTSRDEKTKLVMY